MQEVARRRLLGQAGQGDKKPGTQQANRAIYQAQEVNRAALFH